MDFPVTREQIREIDRRAIEDFGIKGLILMENAGRACAQEAEEMLAGTGGKEVAVFCGPGNNGGDGFVIARHLSNRGAAVHAYLLGSVDRLLRGAGDAAVNLEIVLNMDIPLTETPDPGAAAAAVEQCNAADLIVDAMLGTGLSGQVREPFLSAIGALNRLKRPVLAVDVPSGLDCNTGTPLGAAVRADRTVTFVLSKKGFLQPEAAEYTGRVVVADISVPRRLIEQLVAAWRAGR